jgi:D-glycero-D-manno-heptose 1,7-bisphosphate phosphatase
METYKLIIFDTDGTLVETASGATFRKEASDWQWLPGRIEKLRELKAQGTRLAVATNQGGVAFGYMRQEHILKELTRMLKEGGFSKAALYVCYNHPKATVAEFKHLDNRRKPGCGMLEEAMEDFEAQPEETLMVGDRDEDQEAAQRAGCHFMWAHEFFKGMQ